MPFMAWRSLEHRLMVTRHSQAASGTQVELAEVAVTRGKKLVTTMGCINCHDHPA